MFSISLFLFMPKRPTADLKFPPRSLAIRQLIHRFSNPRFQYIFHKENSPAQPEMRNLLFPHQFIDGILMQTKIPGYIFDRHRTLFHMIFLLSLIQSNEVGIRGCFLVKNLFFIFSQQKSE